MRTATQHGARRRPQTQQPCRCAGGAPVCSGSGPVVVEERPGVVTRRSPRARPPAGGRGSSRSASQPSGSATGRGGAGAAARGAEHLDGIGLVGDAGEQVGQLVEAARHGEGLADIKQPGEKPLRYQATCLRKSVHPCRSPLLLTEQRLRAGA